MTLDRLRMKHAAKIAILRQRPSVFLITLLYMIITYVIDYLFNRITGVPDIIYSMYDAMAQGRLPVMPDLNFDLYAIFLSIGLQIMALILSVGFIQYCLNTSRHQRAGAETLFDGFGLFFRALWLYILQHLLIVLWSILLIIPGIIASYNYRMALYIMLDHPEMSVTQCLRASRKMMRGRKLELLILDLSFLGWALLTAIPFAGIGVLPYMEITYANFYNLISGKGYGEEFRDPLSGADPENSANRDSDNRPPWEY